MTIPFLSYFKRGKGEAAVKENPAAPVKPTIPPLEKPSSERFSKTVMPNATRTLPPQDPFEMAARSTALGGQMPSASGPLPSPRTISFSPLSPTTTRELPPAVALALEPKVERVIAVELADVVASMPPGHVKELSEEDGKRRILVRASEVEKGMASGKPSVSIATIYDQVPEIFIRTIADSETAWQVQLPFAKVLEQFANMHVRADQERHLVVPQVETPFLKVAVEDSSEFGTTMDPLEMNPGEMPSVRVELPTAEAFAAAEPEAVADAKSKMPSARKNNGNGKTPQSPTRIPFKLSPNGTDAPAPESVPASSGPSVPILPSPLAPVSPASPSAPVRIPFKFAPKPGEEPKPEPPPKPEPQAKREEEAKPKVEPWLTNESVAEAQPKPEPWLTKETLAAAIEMPVVENPEATPVVETARTGEVKIALPLLPILKNLPPMQLTGDPSCVPPDVRLELPFSLIEPQLASGRISVTAKVFEVSLPVSFRGLFQAGEGAVDVSLPLQEVLKNLPAASLRMRDDQEEQEAGQNFATPFSAKAEEDAKRFNVPLAPVAKPAVPEAVETPSVVPTAPKVQAAKPETAAVSEASVADKATATEEKTSARPLRTPLQVALDTDEKLDAKGVVARVNKIPGVKACAILFGDGLSLAGSLPGELDTDGLCAMAPSLMQRVENHLVDTKLGQLRGMTLSCAKGAVTFYMHENLCLAALHADVDLPGETRERLSRITHEMSRKYSHPV
ncbi:MAG TPA: roadblock/LC7 domain-containing protein [Chthoniobacterales bacterium]